MSSNLKKASTIIRNSFRSRRFASFDSKENVDLTHRRERFTKSRNLSTSASSSCDENDRDVSTMANPGSPPVRPQPWLRRGTSMSQSMREAVGTLRQKLRMSTRRARLHVTPSRAGTRRHTISGREARLSLPYKASTPNKSGRTHIKTCLSSETPTRLKREVESLTSNMQALNALTPNTLEGRSRTRASPLLTNGSLKVMRPARKHVVTEIC